MCEGDARRREMRVRVVKNVVKNVKSLWYPSVRVAQRGAQIVSDAHVPRARFVVHAPRQRIQQRRVIVIIIIILLPLRPVQHAEPASEVRVRGPVRPPVCTRVVTMQTRAPSAAHSCVGTLGTLGA